MSKKYELAVINQQSFTVDVSALAKNETLFFNATEIAKSFDKKVKDWLRLPDATVYIDAVLKVGLSHLKNFDDVVIIKRGKHGGTWLHNDLSLAFARWLSPDFAVRLDMWTKERIKQEHTWQQTRIDAKTGFKPLTDAIQSAHKDPQHYHYSTENDLLYRIVLGMSAKQYKGYFGVDSVRDNVLAYELEEIARLQTIDTGLIAIGMDYQKRKEHLTRLHQIKAANLPHMDEVSQCA